MRNAFDIQSLQPEQPTKTAQTHPRTWDRGFYFHRHRIVMILQWMKATERPLYPVPRPPTPLSLSLWSPGYFGFIWKPIRTPPSPRPTALLTNRISGNREFNDIRTLENRVCVRIVRFKKNPILLVHYFNIQITYFWGKKKNLLKCFFFFFFNLETLYLEN